jgi:transposase-like protein
MPRKSPYELHLTASERAHLESLARKYTSPYYAVTRAKIVLLAAQGLGNDEIAHRVDVGRQVASKWRKRFWEEGLGGLEDRPREGRPPVFSPLD